MSKKVSYILRALFSIAIWIAVYFVSDSFVPDPYHSVLTYIALIVSYYIGRKLFKPGPDYLADASSFTPEAYSTHVVADIMKTHFLQKDTLLSYNQYTKAESLMFAYYCIMLLLPHRITDTRKLELVQYNYLTAAESVMVNSLGLSQAELKPFFDDRKEMYSACISDETDTNIIMNKMVEYFKNTLLVSASKTCFPISTDVMFSMDAKLASHQFTFIVTNALPKVIEEFVMNISVIARNNLKYL